MPFFMRPISLQNHLIEVRNRIGAMWLLSTYTAGDSYATCLANRVASITVSSANFAVTQVGNDAVMTFTRPSAPNDTANATASVPVGTNMHFAFVNVAESQIEIVTEETSDQSITTGNPVTFPTGITYTARQPVAA